MSLKESIAKSVNIAGRIGRLKHFLRKLLLLVILVPITIGVLVLILVVAAQLGETPALGSSVTVDFFFVVLFLIYAYVLGLLWNVVTVLRLHDLDMDGRWCAVNFIIFIPLILVLFRIYIPQPGHYPLVYTLPAAIFVIFNIYLLFMRGTRGPNKYGPDPFGEKTPELYDPAKDIPKQQPVVKTNSRARFSKAKPLSNRTPQEEKQIAKHKDRYQPKSAKK